VPQHGEMSRQKYGEIEPMLQTEWFEREKRCVLFLFLNFAPEPTPLHQNSCIAVVNQREPSLTVASGREREGAGVCRGRQFR